MDHLLHAYTEILTDPAHTLVELTYVGIDLVLIQRVQAGCRRLMRREHRRIDAEHGVVHTVVVDHAHQSTNA